MRSAVVRGFPLNNTINPNVNLVGVFVFSILTKAHSLMQNSFNNTLAIACDLGSIQNTSEPVVWAVGVVRDPVVQFTNSNGVTEERRAYYWSAYSNIHDAVRHRLRCNKTDHSLSSQTLGVLTGFGDALNDAIALDNQILYDGSHVSTNYYDLLALTTRQAMGAIDITIGQDSSGNLNTSDIKAFMRGAGGIGSGGYVASLFFQLPIGSHIYNFS